MTRRSFFKSVMACLCGLGAASAAATSHEVKAEGEEWQTLTFTACALTSDSTATVIVWVIDPETGKGKEIGFEEPNAYRQVGGRGLAGVGRIE